MWGKLAPLLAPHFQLILVELPGLHGASEVPADQPYYNYCAEKIEEVRVALGIEQWAILAYSTGTRVSEAYIQRHPQYVTQAVFLCPMYLTRPWMLAIWAGQRLNAKYTKLASWFVSGWRLYGWVLVAGFNWRGREHARAWMRELEQRPLVYLKRMLLELPGRGRAPFTLPDSPSLPTLFIWGQHDALVASPHHAGPHDVFLPTSHGAPLLVPQSVAAVVLPFLCQHQMAAVGAPLQ